MKLTKLVAVAAVVLAAISTQQANAQQARFRLEGAWEVTINVAGLGEAPQRMIFSGGSSANDGTVLISTPFDFTAPYPCAPTVGAWKRVGQSTFADTAKAFCFFNIGPYSANLEIRDEIRILAGGQEFSGTEWVHFTVFGEGGPEEFSFQGELHGVRMQVEPIPEP